MAVDDEVECVKGTTRNGTSFEDDEGVGEGEGEGDGVGVARTVGKVNGSESALALVLSALVVLVASGLCCWMLAVLAGDAGFSELELGVCSATDDVEAVVGEDVVLTVSSELTGGVFSATDVEAVDDEDVVLAASSELTEGVFSAVDDKGVDDKGVDDEGVDDEELVWAVTSELTAGVTVTCAVREGTVT